MIKRLRSDQTGATAVEYGLIAALIAVAAIVVIQGTGLSLQNMYDTVATAISNAVLSAA